MWEGTDDLLENIQRLRREFDAHDDLIVPAHTASDIRAAHASSKTAVILGVQNTDSLQGQLDRAQLLHELGIRVMQLTYNNQNFVGGSCYEDSDSGLTRFGRELVAELNRLGILIDLSHVGDRTSRDAIELSAGPVSFTHANPRSFLDVPRNKPDDLLKLLAERGGVLGLCPFGILVPPGPHGEAFCDLDDFCTMVLQVIEMIGIDHVALATDSTFGQPVEFYQWLVSGHWTRDVLITEEPELPAWAQRPSDIAGIVTRLGQRGLNDSDLAAIAGENWMRLFDEVQGQAS